MASRRYYKSVHKSLKIDNWSREEHDFDVNPGTGKFKILNLVTLS